jgi:hypothetical protein
MSFGKWLTDLVMGPDTRQAIPVRAQSRPQSRPQSREQLIAEARAAVRNVTPETRERLAAAFEAQTARQRIDRQLRDAAGAQNMTDVMRRMMGGK